MEFTPKQLSILSLVSQFNTKEIDELVKEVSEDTRNSIDFVELVKAASVAKKEEDKVNESRNFERKGKMCKCTCGHVHNKPKEVLR